MPTPGDKARKKLAKGLKRIANNITIVTRAIGTECPGAFDHYSHEYDPRADRHYHQTHPSAATCVRGLVGATETTAVVKAFHFPSLRDAELQYFGIGELKANEAVFVAPYDQPLTGMLRYEVPTRPGVWYGIFEGYPRSIALNDVDIFWLAKSQEI